MSKLFLILFGISIGANAIGAPCPTKPRYMKPVATECEVIEAGTSDACTTFKNTVNESFEKFSAEMGIYCVEAAKAANAASTDRQQGQQTDNQAMTANSAASLDRLKSALKTFNAQIDEAKKKLKSEIEKESDQACAKGASNCTNAFKNYSKSNGYDETTRYHAVEREKRKIAQQIKTGLSKPSDITGTEKTELAGSLLKQQAEIANAMNKFQREITAEIEHLNPIANELKRQSKVSEDRSNQLASQSENPSGGQQSAGASPAAGGGSGSGSGGGGEGSGEQPAQSNLTDAAYPGDNGTAPTPESKNQNAGAINNNETAGIKTDIGGVSIGGTDPKTNIGADNAVQSGENFEYSSGGASTLPEGSLASKLRKALAAKTGALSSDGGPGIQIGGSNKEPEKKSSAAPVSAANSAGAGSSGGGGGDGGGSEDVLSPFGKPLSDPKFSLAGSETDASVRGMMGNLGSEEDNGTGEEGRDPASDVADGIGERNGPTLFERVKQYNERCAKRSCVSAAKRRLTVGG